MNLLTSKTKDASTNRASFFKALIPIPPGASFSKTIWMGAYSRGTYLQAAKNITRTKLLLYLRLVSMHKRADKLGYIIFEAISKSEHIEKKREESQSRGTDT